MDAQAQYQQVGPQERKKASLFWSSRLGAVLWPCLPVLVFDHLPHKPSTWHGQQLATQLADYQARSSARRAGRSGRLLAVQIFEAGQ